MPILEEVDVRAALAKVIDPEIRKPITELGMVKSVEINGDAVHIVVYLTTSACPLRDEIANRVKKFVSEVPEAETVTVELDVMDDEQRTELRRKLRGDSADPVIPFAQPGSMTRVYAVASGKGGVGKSSVTVNLAAAMAARGLSVGVVDADIYGHSVPRMLGTHAKPTQVERMIMPPTSHDVKVISIAQFTSGNVPVVWRGPMLHRALQQFLADVFWGDLDVLLLDLPPARVTSRSRSHSSSRRRRSLSSPHHRKRPRKSPSARVRSRYRPVSGSSVSSRTCRGSNCPTVSAWRSSGPVVAPRSPKA